jgi:hypothetical protein
MTLPVNAARLRLAGGALAAAAHFAARLAEPPYAI